MELPCGGGKTNIVMFTAMAAKRIKQNLKILILAPNQHLVEDISEELGTELAADQTKIYSDDKDTVSSIYVMTFDDLFKNSKNHDFVEDAFLIVDEGHMFIDVKQGPQLLKRAKYSFCTSATLGDETGRHRIKELIQDKKQNGNKKVECFVNSIGFGLQGPINMEIVDIEKRHQLLRSAEIREHVLKLAYHTVIEKTNAGTPVVLFLNGLNECK